MLRYFVIFPLTRKQFNAQRKVARKKPRTPETSPISVREHALQQMDVFGSNVELSAMKSLFRTIDDLKRALGRDASREDIDFALVNLYARITMLWAQGKRVQRRDDKEMLARILHDRLSTKGKGGKPPREFDYFREELLERAQIAIEAHQGMQEQMMKWNRENPKTQGGHTHRYTEEEITAAFTVKDALREANEDLEWVTPDELEDRLEDLVHHFNARKNRMQKRIKEQ